MDLKSEIQNIIDINKGDVAVAIKTLGSDKEIMINEDMIFPSASTIKLLIMSRIMKEVNDGQRSLDDIIELKEQCKCGGDGILKELDCGHEFTLKEIITLMIILSDNTATNMLIDMIGINNINIMADELNLKSTRLRRKMMDSEAVKQGRENTTCAKDLCRILYLIYDGKLVNGKYSDVMIDILKRQQVGGRLNLYLPDEILIAHKTGDLDKLEHDVGIVYHPKQNYIICVLTKDNSTNKDGRETIGAISKAVFDMINK
ncbi:MAG: class A beta-lactamase-related serine hydrolase [Clostridium sp.]|uniref:serine hydrolase n=1 Tax=Clostridium sp. TaxID=1506 RepID=UPI002A8B36A7|nr:class A beta-lactamase-related serine hydrolase [Clostridium sp.]MDY5097200.1 serine hydrolase [Clostridium sp.]